MLELVSLLKWALEGAHASKYTDHDLFICAFNPEGGALANDVDRCKRAKSQAVAVRKDDESSWPAVNLRRGGSSRPLILGILDISLGKQQTQGIVDT